MSTSILFSSPLLRARELGTRERDEVIKVTQLAVSEPFELLLKCSQWSQLSFKNILHRHSQREHAPLNKSERQAKFKPFKCKLLVLYSCKLLLALIS